MNTLEQISKTLTFLLVGLFLPAILFSQSTYPPEKIDLISDRSVYICGESIFFSAILSSNQNNELFSKVVYTELITPTGEKISQSKIRIDSSSFAGDIKIPEETLSGYYFLRSYTKWMRNGKQTDYAYLRLKLINPYSSETLEIPDSLVDKSKNTFDRLIAEESQILIKTSFNIGEELIINKNIDPTHSYLKTCLSIIPNKTEEVYILPQMETVSNYDQIFYYPETRGVSISGKVIDKDSQQSIAYHKVNIHLKDEMNFISVLSDSIGKFYISLPDRFGTIELFVIAGINEDDKIEVLIDQDFCFKEIALRVPPFSLSNEEKEQFLLMAQTFQLQQLFTTSDSIIDFNSPQPAFYGHPYKTFVIDDYVPLDSLMQYFTDLPTWIKIKKQNKRRKIYIAGDEAEIMYNDPLILIDWVPVNDDEQILALDSRRIKKFDVIIDPYIHGGIIYGGVINLFTRNLDFGGFTFPESAMYINFDFYNNQHSQDHQNQSFYSAFNNTFTWIPDGQNYTDLDDLTLTAPSIKGNYILLIQAINELGERISIKNSFSVD